ncbi:MAG: amidase [Alphaproteobacteria bacterium]|nr:amidase [Alphaproteobacteria bacterium]
MSGELWRWSATALAEAIRTRRISSREAVASVLDRIARVNPRINAVVDLLEADARAAADRADAMVGDGAPLGPLHGVPVTVKINVDYAGRPTTNGVVAFKDAIAREDSSSVTQLKRAGAVIVGRTNVPAFSTRYFTDNDLHGRTLNPFAPDRTPGGSSGGAAAAVAAGMGPIGHGNDRAGSVRYPAYCCGVFGLRPSLGRFASHNPSATEERGISSQMAHAQGPLARTVADIRLALGVMTLPDPHDPWYVPAPLAFPSPTRPIAVAMMASLPGFEVDPAVESTVRLAGGWLAAAGYRVEEVAPPHFEEAGAMFWKLLMTEEKAASSAERAASNRGIEAFGDEAVKRARGGTARWAGTYEFEDYLRAVARRTAILRAWNVFLDRHPVILMPVSWQRPFPIDYDQGGDNAVARMVRAHFPLIAISVLGLPGLSCPTGLADGTPVGVQLVAARYREDLLLDAGAVIEAQNAIVAPTELRA